MGKDALTSTLEDTIMVMSEFLAIAAFAMDCAPHVTKEEFNTWGATDAERCGAWTTRGRPYVWQQVAEENGYTVFLDTGYGTLACSDSEGIVRWGKHTIVMENAVVLDVEYYGASRYLWF